VIGGGAAIRAAGLLKDKVKLVAAHVLNASPETVTIAGGMVHVAGAPEMSRSLRQIAEIAYGEPDRLPPGIETGLEAQYRYNPPPMTFTSAAHACIVEVSAETGFVTIRRWIAAEDCGVMINPAVVEGQIAGGLAQGIGMVLLEEAGYDARGNPQAVTFKDYLLPQITDVPDFEYVHAGTPSKAEGGFRGVGEGGAIIGPPTLVNAIADALSPFGELPLVLPLSPARLLGVIEGRPIADHAEIEVVPVARIVSVESAPVVAASPAATPYLPTTVVDGTWDTVLATPMGPQRIVMTFATKGDLLTGGMTSDQGSETFAGTANGSTLKWDLKVKKPMPITLKYDVVIEGDALRGKVKMGMFGTAKLTGNRAV
jgi:carbon-monoxide dehydrogenase large subunit